MNEIFNPNEVRSITLARGKWMIIRSRIQFTCGGPCRQTHRLPRGFWSIDDNGIMRPSFHCKMPGCDWHVHITLDDWTPRDAAGVEG